MTPTCGQSCTFFVNVGLTVEYSFIFFKKCYMGKCRNMSKHEELSREKELLHFLFQAGFPEKY